MNLKFGRVVWFNRVKQFGFVKPDGEDTEIFLHFGNGRSMEIKNNEIVFSELDVPVDFSYPKVGDFVCFLVTEGSKGRPKCSPWSFTSKFKIADEHLKKFPSTTDIDAFELEICPECGHTMYEHNSGASPCLIPGCHCGDETYEELDDESRIVNLGDTPGGFTICE